MKSKFPSTSRNMSGDAADMKSSEHFWDETEFERLRFAALDAGAETTTWDTYLDRHLHVEWPS